ncbi:MAG: LytTR family DNA-binding domain-containing protein [Salinivirgaceae bacterium]|jgi:DNA-binding LytR/AlgR family response regulator
MRKIRCLLVDDEPLALDVIEDYVLKTPFLELVNKFNSPFQAIEALQNEKVDLIFLDIQMPGLSGIDFSKLLQNGPKIIFTTAYSQFALDGFKVDALDYLVKPINYQEFLKASNKALTWFNLTEQNSNSNAAEEPINKYLFVKSEYKLIKVELSHILYIEGMKDYVKIYLKEQTKPILSLMSLKVLEEKLPSGQFMRIHRSFIVNLEHITKIERNRIIFGAVYIPIADTYKVPFQEFLNKTFLG